MNINGWELPTEHPIEAIWIGRVELPTPCFNISWIKGGLFSALMGLVL
jgi:hypothetical protein